MKKNLLLLLVSVLASTVCAMEELPADRQALSAHRAFVKATTNPFLGEHRTIDDHAANEHVWQGVM